MPNVEKYLPYFDRFDMTKEEKIAYLETLHNILEVFVDRAMNQDVEKPHRTPSAACRKGADKL